MANKEYKIQVNPNMIRVRDEAIKAMITNVGGNHRVHADKKKAVKADVVGRKAKYKNKWD